LALTEALLHHAAQQELILSAVRLDPLLHFCFRQARFWCGALISGLESDAFRSRIE